jgi:hypothetical protein
MGKEIPGADRCVTNSSWRAGGSALLVERPRRCQAFKLLAMGPRGDASERKHRWFSCPIPCRTRWAVAVG